MDKGMVKQNITFYQIKNFASPSQVCLTHETLAKTYSLARLFIFQSCALHMALFTGKLLTRQSQASHEIHLFIFWSLSLHNLSHSSLTIKPTYIQSKMIEEITIKFGMKLKPTQHSWKSQLYNLSFWLFHDETPKQTLDLNVNLGP